MSSEENFLIIVKAKELAVHTFKLTSNCNRYPKKYRFSLVGKLQNKALTLYEVLLEANRIDARKHYTERVSEQTKAIVICDEILFYIELSMNLGLISNGSADYWSKMVSDIKYLTLGWRKKDKERICD
jgi:hypothetical protein